jgi:hypothetical protein
MVEEGGYMAADRVYMAEERGYMAEELGYIPGRALLYCRKSAVMFCNEISVLPI